MIVKYIFDIWMNNITNDIYHNNVCCCILLMWLYIYYMIVGSFRFRNSFNCKVNHWFCSTFLNLLNHQNNKLNQNECLGQFGFLVCLVNLHATTR